jgi:hypothetical protein
MIMTLHLYQFAIFIIGYVALESVPPCLAPIKAMPLTNCKLHPPTHRKHSFLPAEAYLKHSKQPDR